MSSHHFVKDKQEPALIIANGEACSISLLNELLEWNPNIVVLDGAANRVHALGIKFDVLIGDFDGIRDADEIIAAQQPIKVIHDDDQNSTDLEKAIKHLIAEKHQAANIVWATGRRSDHTLNNMLSLFAFKDQIDLNMIDDYSKIFPLKSGFKKKYPAGTPVSLLPIGVVEGVTTKGLKYNLNAELLASGVRSGSSNEAIGAELVEIAFDKGQLLMMECRD